MPNPFDLPDLEDTRPEIIRPFVVLPSRSATDLALHHVDLRVLAIMVKHSDHNGITRIGVATIAKLMKTLPKIVSKSMSRLKRRGYFNLIQPYRAGICNGVRQIVYDVPGTARVDIPVSFKADEPVPL